MSESIGRPNDEGVRFAFGDNWRAFLGTLTENRIVEAERALQKLLGRRRLDGLTMLDIGSGSGIHSLAARRLGARVHSFDFDPASVGCTSELRTRFFPEDAGWIVEQGSILDADYVNRLGTFNIVYSWGVLHHTGRMHDAIRNAATRVVPDGVLVLALYRKTRLCAFWTREKRWYATASPAAQRRATAIFMRLMRLAFLVTGRNFKAHVANYEHVRGMNFVHDIHDWLGGYPYKSASPSEVDELMKRLDFEHIRSFVKPYSVGLFGSGCDEYVYWRRINTVAFANRSIEQLRPDD